MSNLKEIFPGVFLINNMLATRNLDPGHTVYGEKTIEIEGKEYRYWEPTRSKLAAAIKKGLKELPIVPGSSVLYLGAASGTTPSHVSDIVGREGIVFCVEFSPHSVRDLIRVCERRQNMIPILADARKPKDYRKYLKDVDCLFEDVAQPDQARILSMNAKEYLKKGDPTLIAIKSQSIDVSKRPREVYKEVLAELEKNFEVVQSLELEPYEKDHLFVSLRLK